jgi:acyl-CoA synthetase (AMP-forming)/AMP-acid ligase II
MSSFTFYLQVPPAELEDILLSHPQIRDAAVIGVPDEKSGELPKAFVVRANDQLKEKDVADFVKSIVSIYDFKNK